MRRFTDVGPTANFPAGYCNLIAYEPRSLIINIWLHACMHQSRIILSSLKIPRNAKFEIASHYYIAVTLYSTYTLPERCHIPLMIYIHHGSQTDLVSWTLNISTQKACSCHHFLKRSSQKSECRNNFWFGRFVSRLSFSFKLIFGETWIEKIIHIICFIWTVPYAHILMHVLSNLDFFAHLFRQRPIVTKLNRIYSETWRS